MRGVEPLSYIFASKHSYSLGFKDYPCLLGLTGLIYCHHSVPKVYRELIELLMVHLSVPKQVLLDLLGSSLISRSHINNPSIYGFVVFPTVFAVLLISYAIKTKHPHNKQFRVMLRTLSHLYHFFQ